MRPLLFALLLLTTCQSGPAGPVTEAGVLEASDQTLPSGEYIDSYVFSMERGEWLSVQVDALGLDPYLIVIGPSAQQSDLDDSEEGNTAQTRMVLQADETGTWDLRVTSFAPGETGTYTLTYEVTTAPPADALPGKGEAFGQPTETV